MENEQDFAAASELEEQYRNHKVVAFPNQRHRSTVREIAAANNHKASFQQQQQGASNNNSQSPPQRARSLSTGRLRNRTANDLVQDMYDRMGVGLRKGQAMDLNNNNNNEENNPLSPNAQQQQQNENTRVSSPPLGYEGSADFHSRYRKALVSQRGRNRPTNNNNNNTAVSGAPEPVEALSQQPPVQQQQQVELEPRRARSLSRGRPQLAKRWPPVKLQQSQSPPPSMSHSEEVVDPLAVTINHSNSHLVVTNSISPKRSGGGGMVTSPPKRGMLLSQTNNTTTNGQRMQPKVELSPSWNENGSTNQANGYGEEKKEDYAEAQLHGTPSIKERISVYGKTGSSTKTTKNSNGVRRTVDPAYAAQFASRDHPPKIDIYEGKQKESSGEKDELEIGTTMSPSLDPILIGGEERPAHVGSPRNNPKAAETTNASISSRSLKAGNLANAFLASINKKHSLQPHPQQGGVQLSSSFKSPTNFSTTCAPLAEIAVAETGDIHGTDGNSVTGLSTVSGEEFSGSHKKSAWHERNRVSAFRSTAGAYGMKPTVGGGIGSSGGIATANGRLNSFTPNNDMERMVEERVQARVADLEARIEQKLRNLVNHMEDKIMQRLDTLELKMMAAVTKKK